jgi:hypothetical protein
MKGLFEIDFIRACLEKSINDEKFLFKSFFEQIENPNELLRYNDQLKQILGQISNDDKKCVGIITESGESSITNLHSVYCRPISWTLPVTFLVKNRDEVIEKFDNTIDDLRGSKMDCIVLEDNSIIPTYPVGIKSEIKNCSIILISSNPTVSLIETTLSDFVSQYSLIDSVSSQKDSIVYCLDKTNKKVYEFICDPSKEVDGDYEIWNMTLSGLPTTSGTILIYYGTMHKTISVSYYIEATLSDYATAIANSFGTYFGFTATSSGNHIIFTSTTMGKKTESFSSIINVNGLSSTMLKTNEGIDKIYRWSFSSNLNGKKYKSLIKCDISFNGMAMEQPYTLNGNDECILKIRGNATICSEGMSLGNDVTRIGIYYTNVSNVSVTDYLEPLDSPTNYGLENLTYQLRQNGRVKNSENISISSSPSFTFVIDESITTLVAWKNAARYNDQTIINPDTIYTIKELYSIFGDVYEKSITPLKIDTSINISNTDSDVMNISVSMSLQGATK